MSTCTWQTIKDPAYLYANPGNPIIRYPKDFYQDTCTSSTSKLLLIQFRNRLCLTALLGASAVSGARTIKLFLHHSDCKGLIQLFLKVSHIVWMQPWQIDSAGLHSCIMTTPCLAHKRCMRPSKGYISPFLSHLPPLVTIFKEEAQVASTRPSLSSQSASIKPMDILPIITHCELRPMWSHDSSWGFL